MSIRGYKIVLVMGVVVLFLLSGMVWRFLLQSDQTIPDELRYLLMVYSGWIIFLCILGGILFWRVLNQISRCHKIIDGITEGDTKRWRKPLDRDLQIIVSEWMKDVSEVREVCGNIEAMKDGMVQEVQKLVSSLDRYSGEISCISQFFLSGRQKVEDLQKDIGDLKKHIPSLKKKIPELSKTERELKCILEDFQNGGNRISGELTETENICRELLETVRTVAGRNEYMERLAEDIAEVSSRLNLLTVDTAIEASHLGEDGKAVAMIAEEMREIDRYIYELKERLLSGVKGVYDGISTIGVLIEKCLNQLKKGIQSVYSIQHKIHITSERATDQDNYITEMQRGLDQQDSNLTQILSSINEFLLKQEEVEKKLMEMKDIFPVFCSSIRKIENDLESVISSINRLKDRGPGYDFSG